MPVDQSLVGREFPPTRPYAVSAEKIREFATATGAPYDGGPAPATFPIVIAFEAMNAFLEPTSASSCSGSCTASSGSPTSGRSCPATCSPRP